MKLWSPAADGVAGRRPLHRRPVLLVNLDFRDVVYSHLWGQAVLAACRRRDYLVDVVTVNPFAGRDVALELGVPRSALDLQTDGKVAYVDHPDARQAQDAIAPLLQRPQPYQTVILNCEAPLFVHLLVERERQLTKPIWSVYDRHLHRELRALADDRLRQRIAASPYLHVYTLQEIATDSAMAFSQDGIVETFRQLGLSEHNIRLQKWPLDEQFFSAAETAASDELVLFSGGDSGRDHATLFEAIRDLPVQLRLCASNVPQPVPANVTLLPRLPLHRFRDEMARAHLVVVPLTGEPLVSGITVIAMAKMMGKPVVVSDNAVVRIHVPAQGDGGYLTQTGNPTMLRLLLRGLIETPAERERLAREGRAQAMDDLNLTRFAERMLDLR